jgi:hypothetical protein
MPPTPQDPPSTQRLLLSGSYEYLTEGYYECQDAELSVGGDVMPTCADALDAYVVPIALEKASKAGLAVPDWVLTNEYFPVPAVCYGVNPFSRKYAIVRTESEREAAAKQLTWNGKYTICCQRITASTEVVDFRMVCGRTEQTELAEWADRLFGLFRIPIATARLLRHVDPDAGEASAWGHVAKRASTSATRNGDRAGHGRLELSAIEPLPFKFLTPTERAWARDYVEAPRG